MKHQAGDQKNAARRKRRGARELRELILDAAAEEFEAHGYAGATTAAIARRASVTEAQMFRMFPAKTALFHAAIFEPLSRHFTAFQAGAAPHATLEGQARAYIAQLQDFMNSHARMLMSLVVAESYPSGGRPDDARGMATYFEQGAAMMRQRLGNNSGVHPELMVRVSFAAVLGCALFSDWIFPEGLATPGQIQEAVADFVIKGIGARSDHPENAGPADEEPEAAGPAATEA